MKLTELEPDSRYLIERKRRFRIVLAAVPALVGALFWFFSGNLDSIFLDRLGVSRQFLFLAAAISVSISALSLMQTYLQTGFKTSSEINLQALRAKEEKELELSLEQTISAELFQKIEEDIDVIRKQIHDTRSALSDVNEGTRASLVAELKASLQNEAATAILEDLKLRVAADHQRISKDRELAARFDESRSRLQQEIEALGRRGNLNLGLGAITTIIGISLLGFSVFAEASITKDIWTLASHFAPRLALVLLIELFAYFFLSLYKNSLSEIKYFQNELTNIESRQLALRAAMESKEASLLADVIGKLAATERNHILSKEQTTIELEKVRIDKESQSNLLEALAVFFQKKA